MIQRRKSIQDYSDKNKIIQILKLPYQDFETIYFKSGREERRYYKK